MDHFSLAVEKGIAINRHPLILVYTHASMLTRGSGAGMYMT